MTSKIHHLVDGHGRPLVVLVGAGQAHDGPVFEHLLAHLKVGRSGGGRARTRPDRVRGDKAYSSRATRMLLRRRRIGAAIPEPADQIANR
ncbi:transposase, partial [Mycolicibacterium phocaicum]|uniref:transposase n=1 Tax=Mycolicibacterium phocaicum TaxID=319706 RepID=UPI0019D654B1